MEDVREFGLYVTSNESYSHIVFGNSDKSACGLSIIIVNAPHPNGEVRWFKPTDEFKQFVELCRPQPDGYRFCKKCLRSFDNWYSKTLNKEV